MLHMTTTFVVRMPRETRQHVRVSTEAPVKSHDHAADAKEQRRKRIAALSRVTNAIYGEAFARLAK